MNKQLSAEDRALIEAHLKTRGATVINKTDPNEFVTFRGHVIMRTRKAVKIADVHGATAWIPLGQYEKPDRPGFVSVRRGQLWRTVLNCNTVSYGGAGKVFRG